MALLDKIGKKLEKPGFDPGPKKPYDAAKERNYEKEKEKRVAHL